MLAFIRKKVILLPASFLMVFLVLLSSLMPVNSFALTSGPSQPELNSFTPAGAESMVDPFTGNFSYNIPLMDIDGYPINIAYNAGVTMEQEASWVGLGWNLSVGSITRNMRGLPDDFNGSDVVTKELNIRPNKTVGISFKPDVEIFGSLTTKISKLDKLKLGNLGLSYNNYTGLGFEAGLSAEIAGAKKNSTLDLSYSSQLGFEPGYEYTLLRKSGFYMGKIKVALNSRQGLKDVSFENRDEDITEMNFQAFASSSQIPSINPAMNNTNFSFEVKLGSEVTPAIFANAEITGYYSEQKLKNNSLSHPAYGYYYLQNHLSTNDLLDFNRTDNNPFIKTMPYFSGSQLTYDQFSFSGQGMNGGFRLHRSDLGQTHDPTVNSDDVGVGLGLEPGVGTGFHLGFNPRISYAKSKSGRWNYNNLNLNNNLAFSQRTAEDPLYEPAYFKIYGDKTSTQAGVPDFMLQKSSSKIPLNGNYGNVSTDAAITTAGNLHLISSKVKFPERRKRVRSIHSLTSQEAKYAGVETVIRNYPLNTFWDNEKILGYSSIARDLSFRKSHHFSEFTALNEQGSRYVYGIPAYNRSTEEVSFNVSGNQHLPGNLVSYSAKDASTSNEKGMDRYYSKTVTPPYAHSYMLTSILSPHFTDLTGNGPSVDDLGDYVKFNYSKVYDDFGWRTPTATDLSNYAALDKRNHSLNHDDQAHYVYGSKEIWYLHSIETKNYVAVFELKERRDGLGVKNSSGEFDPDKPLMKLTKISLFTRNELSQRKENAIPLRQVNFEYDYALCPNVSNNTGTSEMVNGEDINNAKGKLTLKKISFKSGRSNRSLLSPYSFEYSTFNPSYNRMENDRWGNYSLQTSNPDNTEYPYTIQDKANLDLYANAWNLSAVTLPSGGRIEVTYEADDYAYVQNVPAARMFKIAGVGRNKDYQSKDKLTSPLTNRLHVYVKLDEALTYHSEFKEQYIGDMKYLYFKNYIDITGKGDYEYINGYAEIHGAGVCSNDKNYGWIELKYMPSGDAQTLSSPIINPFSWYALKYARMNLQEKIYPLSNINFDNDKVKLGRALVNVVTDFLSLAVGKNAALLGSGFCNYLDKNKSWMRLYDPKKRKLGGGHRVRSIKRYDQWKDLSGSNISSYYGQEYDYSTKDLSGNVISSGVAAYEPLIGGDENSMHKPVFYKHRLSLFSGTTSYLELPYAEESFPAPVVGYSKVTVKNISRDKVKVHATGHTQYLFYTSRSHPTKIERTALERKGIPNILSGLGSMMIKAEIATTAVSQGFLIASNDMHGKPRSVFHYSEFDSNTPISGVEYDYYTLGKKVKTVNSDGTTGFDYLGREADVFLDTKHANTTGGSLGIESNVDVFILGIIPLMTITGYPDMSFVSKTFSASSVTKIIHDQGIIESVKAYDMGSLIEAKNLAFDKETGKAMVTETINEFNDAEYQTAQPAYWVYPPMGPSYRNIKASGTIEIQGGQAPISANEHFIPGDELLVYKMINPILSAPSPGKKIWVTRKKNSNIKLHLRDGSYPEDGLYSYTITRSGYRNNLSSNTAQVLGMENPIKSNNFSIGDSIIEASAATYTHGTSLPCQFTRWDKCPDQDCERNITCVDSSFYKNKYSHGLRGNWHPRATYLYHGKRDYQAPGNANSTNVRYDGMYGQFSPYWGYNGNKWVKSGDPSWVKMNEVSAFTSNGNEIENKDALGNYSAALFGYNQTKAVAVAGNARYREVFFDNMEEYVFSKNNTNCIPMERVYLNDLEISGCLVQKNNTNPIMDTTATPGLVLGSEAPWTSPITVVSGGESLKCIDDNLISNTAHTGLYSYAVPSNTAYFQFPVASDDDCLDHFSIYPEKDYILSVWIKEPEAAFGVLSYGTTVTLTPGPGLYTPQTFSTSGMVIEGWQKLEGVFRAPANTGYVEFGFTSSTGDSIYIDDIRIFPADARMSTNVFHPNSLQLMAQLDDNNYAALYEYGQENELRRIKKETERGVQTVQEMMANLHKTPPAPKWGTNVQSNIWPGQFIKP